MLVRTFPNIEKELVPADCGVLKPYMFSFVSSITSSEQKRDKPTCRAVQAMCSCRSGHLACFFKFASVDLWFDVSAHTVGSYMSVSKALTGTTKPYLAYEKPQAHPIVQFGDG